MALYGTLVKQVIIKSDVDMFHELFVYKPHQLPEICPGFIKGVRPDEGERGVVGSASVFEFIHDGETKVAKKVIEEIDSEKKFICYKMIEGDIMEYYKTFSFKIQVDTQGEENFVTWTFHYEKVNANVEDPHSFMDFCVNMTKVIDTHHLCQVKLDLNFQ